MSMYRFVTRHHIGCLLGLLFLAISALGFKNNFSSNWYDSFFNQLKKQNITSYRLLFIWVQGDMGPEVRPIGGDPTQFAHWQKHTESLLSHVASRALLDRAMPKFQIEIVLDEPTYRKHRALFDLWQERYPSYIRLTQLNQLYRLYPELSWVLGQCRSGVPALCSDVIRIWHLPQNYSMNVYLDIDTFIDRHEGKNKLSSALSLGAQVKNKGVYHAVQTSPRASGNLCNNDIIVDYGSNNWPLIKSIALGSLENYKHPWQALTKRHTWHQVDGRANYQRQLEERLTWWVSHPYDNFHPLGMVVQINGPWFWLHLTAEGHSGFYQIPVTLNSGSWKGGREVSIKGSMNYASLKHWMGASAPRILRLTLMAADYQYLKAYEVAWRDELVSWVRREWLALSVLERESLKEALGSPMRWAEAIANNESH